MWRLPNLPDEDPLRLGGCGVVLRYRDAELAGGVGARGAPDRNLVESKLMQLQHEQLVLAGSSVVLTGQCCAVWPDDGYARVKVSKGSYQDGDDVAQLGIEREGVQLSGADESTLSFPVGEWDWLVDCERQGVGVTAAEVVAVYHVNPPSP
jgi:hypothetical protein